MCVICLDADASPAPIQSGCACRGEAGLAHVGCRVRAAEAQAQHRGRAAWWECQTCKQHFTGEMRRGLAEAWWARVRGRAEDDSERISAASYLGSSLSEQGKHTEAEALQRQVLEVEELVLGPEHPDTLTAKDNLANSLSGQGKDTEAEVLQRQVLEARERVLGPEHPHTLTTKGNLANSLSGQGKHPEAEALLRQVLEARERVLGPEHPHTLTTKCNLASSLWDQGKYPEAEVLRRQVTAARERLHLARKRVPGLDDPDTLTTKGNLQVASLLKQTASFLKKTVALPRAFSRRHRLTQLII
jgi:tetratricopeptide (TPR) repeat protein